MTICFRLGMDDTCHYYIKQECFSLYAKTYITTFSGAGDVWFSLRNNTYQNNSIVTLEDIGEGDDALLCVTNLTNCCQASRTNWFFPNGTRVPSNGVQWDFHRSRGQMMVRMHRKIGGVIGIYHCVIPDSMNVAQSIYIGVYNANTSDGE